MQQKPQSFWASLLIVLAIVFAGYAFSAIRTEVAQNRYEQIAPLIEQRRPSRSSQILVKSAHTSAPGNGATLHLPENWQLTGIPGLVIETTTIPGLQFAGGLR